MSRVLFMRLVCFVFILNQVRAIFIQEYRQHDMAKRGRGAIYKTNYYKLRKLEKALGKFVHMLEDNKQGSVNSNLSDFEVQLLGLLLLELDKVSENIPRNVPQFWYTRQGR